MAMNFGCLTFSVGMGGEMGGMGVDMSTPEETFDKLLGLGESWRVIRAEYQADKQTFVICVEETVKLWAEESTRLGQRVSCYHRLAPMQWRHLNVFNKECVIVSALPRGETGWTGVCTG